MFDFENSPSLNTPVTRAAAPANDCTPVKLPEILAAKNRLAHERDVPRNRCSSTPTVLCFSGTSQEEFAFAALEVSEGAGKFVLSFGEAAKFGKEVAADGGSKW